MSAGKVLLGVLAGVAVGATLGILLAPEKGEVTRKKIAEKGDDYAGELEEKFNKFVDTVAKQFASMKKEAKAKAEEGMEMVKEEAGHAMRTGGMNEPTV